MARQTHPASKWWLSITVPRTARRHWYENWPKSYPVPLRLIVNPANRGFCAANNQGFAASQSELIALLNNDAEAEPGWLEALESVIGLHDDVGMAASKILVWEDPGKIDKCGHLMYPDGQNRGRGSGQLDQRPVRPRGGGAVAGRMRGHVPPCDARRRWRFRRGVFRVRRRRRTGFAGRIAGWRCFYAPGRWFAITAARRWESAPPAV